MSQYLIISSSQGAIFIPTPSLRDPKSNDSLFSSGQNLTLFWTKQEQEINLEDESWINQGVIGLLNIYY